MKPPEERRKRTLTPTSIIVSSRDGVYMNSTYTYDASGSITQIVNSTVVKTYRYDELDYLTGSNGPWGSVSCTHDSMVNIFTGESITYTVNTTMSRLIRIETTDNSLELYYVRV